MTSRGKTLDLSGRLVLLSEQVIKLSLLGLLICLAYVIYGLASGSLDGFGQLPAQEQARLAGNFTLGLRGLIWCSAFLGLALGVRFWQEEAAGYALAIAGAAAFWGFPLALRLTGEAVPAVLQPAVLDTAQRIGFFLLIPGSAIIAYDLTRRLQEAWVGRRTRTVRMPEERDWVPGEGKYPVMCWMTSYCRPYVREVCPRYIERRPCWWRKEGCFCEESIIFRAMEVKEGSANFFKQMRRSLGSTESNKLTAAQKRERCRKCPIYAQHQRLKYRILMPLAFPAVFALLWVNADRLRQWLVMSVAWLDQMTAELSFKVGERTGGSTPTVIPGFQEAFASNFMYWAFMFFLYMLLLAWLLRFIEWLTLKVQV